jgi:hypothetical protein
MQKYRLANGSDLLANASHTHRTSIHTSLLFGHSSLSGVTPAPPRHPSLTRARAGFRYKMSTGTATPKRGSNGRIHDDTPVVRPTNELQTISHIA